MPLLDGTVDINKDKAAREMEELVVKNATKNHKPLKPLNVEDLCYRRHFDGNKTLRIESMQGNQGPQKWRIILHQRPGDREDLP